MSKAPVHGDNVALEAALRDAASQAYVLMLFVSGTTPNSVRAIAKVREMCASQLAGRHELVIVDIYQQPELARAEQVIAAPTLLRKRPLPARRLVGNMEDVERILLALPVTVPEPAP